MRRAERGKGQKEGLRRNRRKPTFFPGSLRRDRNKRIVETKTGIALNYGQVFLWVDACGSPGFEV